MSTVAGGGVAVMLGAYAHMPAGVAAGVGAGMAVALGLITSWAFCTSSRAYKAAEAASSAASVGMSTGRPAAQGFSAGAVPDWVSQGGALSFGSRPIEGDIAAPSSASAQPARSPAADVPNPSSPAPQPGALLHPRPVDETIALRPGAAKPVARRSAEESGILGAVARTHMRGAPAPSGQKGTGEAGPSGPLDGPRGGVADDLKLIRGIGPALEAMLNAEGIWHFDQIAAWKARDIAAIDARLGRFYGRITRDGWVRQARILVAAGPKARAGSPGIEAPVEAGAAADDMSGPAVVPGRIADPTSLSAAGEGRPLNGTRGGGAGGVGHG